VASNRGWWCYLFIY